MKKVLIFILFLFSCSFAINSFTYPWIINLTGDTATVVKWKGNNDTVKAFCDRAADTISFHSRQIDSVQSLYTPWSLFSNHDSTFKWMKIDTVQILVLNDSISAAEVGKLNGVTENIQAGLNSKAPLSHGVSTNYYFNASSSTAANKSKILDTLGGVGVKGNISVNATTLRGNSSYAQVRFGKVGNMQAYSGVSTATATYRTSNEEYDTSGNWRFLIDGYATMYLQDAGYHKFRTSSASGTAGGVVTNTDVFWITPAGDYQTFGNILSYDGSATDGGYFDVNNNLIATKKVIAVGGFSTNGADTLKYSTQTFFDSLYDGATYRARASCWAVRTGNSVTLHQGVMSGTITASTLTYIKGIPAEFLPDSSASVLALGTAAGTAEILNIVFVPPATVRIERVSSAFLGAGTGGITPVAAEISYTLKKLD